MDKEKQAKWDLAVTELKGVSKVRAKQLEKLGIVSLGDLVNHFPRRYEDWTSIKSIASLENGEEAVFLAQVAKAPTVFRKGKKAILQCSLRDPSAMIKGVWFNQAYLQDKLEIGEIYLFRGKIKREVRSFQVYNPQFTKQEGVEFPEFGQSLAEVVQDTFVRPIYPATQGLGQYLLRNLVEQALAELADEIQEVLPFAIRKEENLAGLAWSYEQIHHPEFLANYQIARKRLAFDELFYLQLGLRLNKAEGLRRKAIPLAYTKDSKSFALLQECIVNLPYALTSDQKQAVKDILNDMNQNHAMNRLLQGDVGSGKTIVAFLAMYAQGLNKQQSVLMAPTGILAKQHEANFRKTFPQIPKEAIACLSGDVPAKEKRKIYEGLQNGEILYLIGTHAVIQKEVHFQSLALAVTDEQHRFGVKQRLELRQEEEAHVLVMSATPIPRTLGLVLYGDLDVSILAEKPPGRMPIQTFTARTKDNQRVYELIRRFVAQNEQVYVVCPMVSESETMDLESAESLYELYSKEIFPDLSIALLHGQMKEKEKNAVMQEFLDKRIQVLVSTTVIEVGVDNPNASMMLIRNAERFGLAQLHQLRGRIGRGNKQALCVLHSDVGEGLARERLTALCQSEDGFVLAEKDLALRGPGDFFGTRQHGLPEFKIANLYEDQELLQKTAMWADRLLKEDKNLSSVEHEALRERTKRFLRSREQ